MSLRLSHCSVQNIRLSKTNNQGNVEANIDGDDITKMSSTELGETSTSSTTTFTNQNPTNILRVVSDTPHKRSIVDSATTGNLDQSLASFMAKPVPIATGSITSANLAGTQVFKFSIADQFAAQPIWKSKIDGFMNVRGTACVRLQINANPFQAGRLILGYLPQYKHSPRSYTTHLYNLTTITQIPHVEMSFQDTECELEIPYIAPTTHYNVLSGLYDWGTVFCYIYSPLAVGSGGTNQVTYTAWLSFDDFELQVPIVPQAGGGSIQGKRSVIRKYRVNAIKSNIDSEVNEGKGPVSSVLANVSSIASTLYSIPMLAPIAGPTAWFTNMMSGAASAFGWSKPILDTPVCRMFNNPVAYLANSNEADVANNLGLFADNKVNVMPDVNLSGVDEMSLSFIKRQKAFVRKLDWTTTTLPGSLVALLINPSAMGSTNATVPVGLTSGIVSRCDAPIAFLSRFFQLWRGSIEFHFKIIKTQYHTGRLIIAFEPDVTGASINNSDTNYLHREIIDLRDGSEFCVTVPYCYNAMYMDTNQNSNDTYMKLHVNVLNELVAPETCSQSVEILIEVRGGKDLEFQLPVSFRSNPVQIIEPQAGGDEQAPPVLCNNIGGSTVHDPAAMASSLCIGEHITSILQLCKRYIKLSCSATLSTQNLMNMYPFIWGGFYSNGVISGGSEAPLTGDYLGAFAGCFAHSRGGVRYRMVCDPVSESDITAGSMLAGYVPFSPATTGPFNLGSATALQSLSMPANAQIIGAVVNGVNTFDTSYAAGTAINYPMYGRTFTRLNRLFFNNNNSGSINQPLYPSTAPDVSSQWLQIVSTTTSFGTATSLYRCAADDFQFSFWIGVPVMGYLIP